tara:strand:- start:180 stop:425 length:246 start_codon:yes stop_codon:yes gene_type:complete
MRAPKPPVLMPAAFMLCQTRQRGWLLLTVVMVVLLVAAGVVMLMSQAHLGLRMTRQEHQEIQQKLNRWPPLLKHREYIDAP